MAQTGSPDSMGVPINYTIAHEMFSGNGTSNGTGKGLQPSSQDQCATLNFSHPVKVDNTQFSIASTVGLLTIMGNFMSLLVVGNILRRRKDTRNGSTIYLFSLASSDFLQALFVYPIHIAAQVKGQWLGGYFTCMLMAYAGNFFYILSAFIVTLLAIVRYGATSRPLSFKPHLERTKLWMHIFLGVVLFSTVISALPFTRLGCISFHASGAICSYDWHTTGLASVSPIMIFATQSVMLLVIITCTAGTIYSLHAQSKRHTAILKRMERNFSMGVVAIATVQVICWGPFVVWQSISRSTGIINPIAAMVAGYLTFFVSVFNPIVFAAMMKPYRDDIRRLLCLVFACRQCNYEDDHDSDSSRHRRISSSSVTKPLMTTSISSYGKKGNISQAKAEDILKKYQPKKEQKSPLIVDLNKTGNGGNCQHSDALGSSCCRSDTAC